MSRHAYEKIAKKTGIRRMSKDGVEELMDIVNDYGFEIARKAVQVSMHSGKRTVQKRDVEFAAGK